MTKPSDRAIAQAFYEIGAGNSEQAINWQRIERRAREIDAAAPEGAQVPIPMLLFCPACGTQHVDAPESAEWTNPPHRSHLCHNCGCIWRPADVPTIGVERIETRGKADTWDGAKVKPEGAQGADSEADRIIGRLMSSDPDFDDCAEAAALIARLVAANKGPDGFATWKDAAVAERLHRVALERATPPQPQDAQGAVAEVTHASADNYGQHRRIRWLTEAAIPVGAKLYTTPPQPQDAAQFVAGVEAAAAWIDARRWAFASDHGSIDPDTGALEFPGGRLGQLQEEYHCELAEIADGLRALKVQHG